MQDLYKNHVFSDFGAGLAVTKKFWHKKGGTRQDVIMNTRQTARYVFKMNKTRELIE